MTSTAVTGEWLESLLTGLGNTADEVAAALHTASIKGYRNDPSDCPGARFVAARARELLPAADDIAVTLTAEAAVIIITPATSSGYWVEASTPEPVEDSLDRFDTGDYEELAETPSA